jgi:hypothetical protein
MLTSKAKSIRLGINLLMSAMCGLIGAAAMGNTTQMITRSEHAVTAVQLMYILGIVMWCWRQVELFNMDAKEKSTWACMLIGFVAVLVPFFLLIPDKNKPKFKVGQAVKTWGAGYVEYTGTILKIRRHPENGIEYYVRMPGGEWWTNELRLEAK